MIQSLLGRSCFFTVLPAPFFIDSSEVVWMSRREDVLLEGEKVKGKAVVVRREGFRRLWARSIGVKYFLPRIRLGEGVVGVGRTTSQSSKIVLEESLE